MMSKPVKVVIALIIILLIAGGVYWYYIMRTPYTPMTDTTGNSTSSGFNPYGRNPVQTGGTSNTSTNTGNQVIMSTSTAASAPILVLRLLSDTPIGGYSASTTGTTTAVRWIDRGRGNVYEAHEGSLNIQTISNTLLPRVYSSVWNANLNAFIASLLPDNSSVPTTVYAGIIKQQAAGTSTLNSTVTPYALKGSNLPDGVIGFAVSPKKDKVFLLIADGNGSSGYLASFDGKSMTKLFSTPLTELNVDWPTDGSIALTTKGASDALGYLYLVDVKSGTWKKAVGPLPGLSAKVSRDGKYAFISVAGASNNIVTAIYNLQKGTNTDAVIRTLADKCVWGNFYKNLIYCAVPFQPVSGNYPEDWYTGSVAFTDKIWQINADTGELHQVSSLFDQSDRIIDGFNLGLDPKDNYLFFMNKNDLSFWSLDLVTQH